MATSRRTGRWPQLPSRSSTGGRTRPSSSTTTTSTSCRRSSGQARPAARIAHFVHIPWVGPTDWSVLPGAIARAIHEGLLACDSVGFHTERWRAAFVESCEALLARGDEAEARSHANPIAVDVHELDGARRKPGRPGASARPARGAP